MHMHKPADCRTGGIIEISRVRKGPNPVSGVYKQGLDL